MNCCVFRWVETSSDSANLHISFRSVMPACAAMYPGAPVTPPPGWAPLPHSRSLFMGVKGGGAPMSTGVGRFRNSWFIDSAP